MTKQWLPCLDCPSCRRAVSSPGWFKCSSTAPFECGAPLPTAIFKAANSGCSLGALHIVHSTLRQFEQKAWQTPYCLLSSMFSSCRHVMLALTSAPHLAKLLRQHRLPACRYLQGPFCQHPCCYQCCRWCGKPRKQHRTRFQPQHRWVSCDQLEHRYCPCCRSICRTNGQRCCLIQQRCLFNGCQFRLRTILLAARILTI